MKISVHNTSEGLNAFIEEDVNFNGLIDIASSKSYSLSTFKGNIRQSINFMSTEALGLDIDNDSDDHHMSLEDAKLAFKSYQHIIMTTKSHQKSMKNGKEIKKTDRFRVILFLSKPITDTKTFQATWHALQDKYPAIDKACKDPSRFWYASPEVVSYRAVGDLIDPVEPRKEVERVSTPSVLIDMADKGKLSTATYEFMASGAPDGSWNTTLYKAARDCHQQRYSEEEAIALLTKATIGYSGALDKTDLRTIKQAYSQPPKHEPRLDPNEMLRNFILKSHHIVDVSDSSRQFFINLDTGISKEVDYRIASQLLSKDELSILKQKRTMYCELSYLPNVPNVIQMSNDEVTPLFNTYNPPFWYRNHFYGLEPPKQGHIPPLMMRYLKHFTANHQPSLEYMLDWLSTALNSRNYTILTAVGEPGIGKGVLGDIMQLIFGNTNYSKTRDTVFKNHFNAQIDNKQLVFVDELALTTKEAHDRLKDVVNNWVEVEAKGKDAKLIENQASFYIVSNHIDALKLEPGDRRISAIELTDRELREEFSLEEIQKLQSKEIVEPFAWYLKNRKVSRNMLIPFRSEKFKEMMESSLANWAQWLLYNYIPTLTCASKPLADVQEQIRTEFPQFNPPGPEKFKKLAGLYKHIFKIKRVQKEGVREYILEVVRKEEE